MATRRASDPPAKSANGAKERPCGSWSSWPRNGRPGYRSAASVLPDPMQPGGYFFRSPRLLASRCR